MSFISACRTLAVGAALPTLSVSAAEARQVIELDAAVQLSGAAANWDKGDDLMCRKAAREIADAGGVRVASKSRNFEFLTRPQWNASEESATQTAMKLLFTRLQIGAFYVLFSLAATLRQSAPTSNQNA